MAMSASCTITNNTGSTIIISAIGPINNDPGWSAPGAGQKFKNGESFTIYMGGESLPITPEAVGFNLTFVCQSHQQTGGILFSDPAVGAHSFTYANTAIFDYSTQNPTGNSFSVEVSLAS